MTKHNRTKRNQKGGNWLDTSTWFNNSQSTSSYYPTQSWSDYFKSWGDKVKQSTSGLFDTNTFTNQSNNGIYNANQGLSPPINVNQPINVNPPINVNSYENVNPNINQYENFDQMNGSYGGKRKRRSRSMKGGKGGLGLTYYATPVSGLRVAEPTTWQYYRNGTNQYTVKGGSKKNRRRTRRNKRH